MPESGSPTIGKVLDRHALLLDPREVAEVKDPLPLGKDQLAQMVGGDTSEIPAKDLGSGQLIESVGSLDPEKMAMSLEVEIS